MEHKNKINQAHSMSFQTFFKSKRFFQFFSTTLAIIIAFFIHPHASEAIMFLLIMPLTLGGVIGTIILEAALWCAAGIICGGGGGGGGGGGECPVALPTVNFEAEYVDPDSVWGESPLEEGENHIVGPSDEIELSWDSDGDRCAIQLNTEDATSTSTTGTHRFLPGEEIGVGNVGTYSIMCQTTDDESCTESKIYTFEIPEPNVEDDDFFSIDPNIVRQTDRTNLSWNITADDREPYSMNCAIYGAIPAETEIEGITPTVPDAPFSFDAALLPSATVQSIPLMNKFINTLICSEPISEYVGSSTDEVEVIPTQAEI